MAHLAKARTVTTAAGLILCFSAAHAVADNLLTNPGFELPPSTAGDDQAFAGWAINGDIYRAGFAAHTGAKGLWAKTFLPEGDVSQVVDITAGANYLFSVWNKYEARFNTTTAIIRQGVTWLDASENPVGQNLFSFDGTTIGGSAGTWMQREGFELHNLTAPAGAAKARVTIGWDSGGGSGGQLGFFIDDIVFDGPGTPPPPTPADWLPVNSGDYNVSTNWATGEVPNGIGKSANFVGTITQSRTVYTDLPITLGALKFDNNNTYVLTGAGNLTFDVTSGNASINVVRGTHKLNLPTRLNDTTVATVAAGATLQVADPLTLSSGTTLQKTGDGTIEYLSTVTTLGPATLMTSAGTANLRMDVGSGTTINAAGGNTRAFATQRVASVQIGAAGTLAIDSAGATKVLKTNSLTITSGGKLDIGDNALIVDYDGASTVEAVRAAIVTGRAGGAYNGPGINTSAVAPGRGIGYADSTALGVTSFLGESFTGGAVLVRYTLLGDSNLNGVVNFDDLLVLAQNYNLNGRRWIHGDSNHDQSVNFDDLLALAQNYGSSLPSLDELTAAGGADFASDWALALSLVPEPTSLAALGLLGAMMGRRRSN